jgi:hypothetical protein
MADDYRSKGVHRNRKGGKTRRTPLTRAGSPFKPKPRTVQDTISSAIEAGGGRIPTTAEVPAGKMTEEIGRRASQQAAAATKKRTGPTRQQKIAAATKAASSMADAMAADQAKFNAEHDRAVQEGAVMHQRMRASRPGRAQEIIKKRRV